jgi:hypothetical protein
MEECVTNVLMWLGIISSFIPPQFSGSINYGSWYRSEALSYTSIFDTKLVANLGG